MIKINVITKDKHWFNYISRPKYYLEKKIDILNSKEKKFKKNKISCTFLLSGNKEIKYLNKKFRKKNKTTDILSFPFQTKKELKKKLKERTKIYLGDIIINFNKIKKKKENFKIEFDKLWIHGLVHLFGYEHEKKKDYKDMLKIEKRYFNFIND